MKISFIIASVNRDKQLHQCIFSIEKAHMHNRSISVEILVVIQKAKQKKDMKLSYPELTTFYYINNMGLSVARNYAIKKSTGDYFVFIDDDASVSENFIDELSNGVISYDKTNAFCGRLIDPVQHIPFSVLFRSNEVKRLRRLDYQYFMGSAHILSRKAIEKIGCYDERFGCGSKCFGSEESDIFFRLKAANEEVIYLPNLIFYHPIPVAFSQYVYNYSYAFGAALTKNCINDKASFFIYLFITLKIIIKACIRILQKLILKGVYLEKDKMYHYGCVLRGTIKGVKYIVSKEFRFENN